MKFLRDWWPLLVLGVLAIGGGGAVVYKMTRGLRNNNPGNLRDTGIQWEGLDNPRSDGAFLRFSSQFYGLRALARLLANYERLHGLRSVQQIISRYAPAVENNTAAYVDAVSAALGVLPGQAFSVRSRLPELVAAIVKHENGIQPFSADEIGAAVNAATVGLS